MAVEIKTNNNMDNFSFEWRSCRKGIRRNNKAKRPKSKRLQRADDGPRVTCIVEVGAEERALEQCGPKGVGQVWRRKVLVVTEE